MEQNESDWIDVAEKAFALLRIPAPRGRKQAYETEIAARFGLARSTLEAYMAAFKFLKHLRQSHPDLADRMKRTRAPAISVKAIAQWAKINEAAALDFIASHDDFRARETLQAVAEARQAARRPTTGSTPADIVEAFRQWEETVAHGRSPGSFRPEIRRQLAALGWHDYFGFAELEWEDCDDPYATSLGVSKVGYLPEIPERLRFFDHRRSPIEDRWRRRGDRRTMMVGNITVAPRQLLESFGREAKVAWNRWVVAATLYPVTIVVFPDKAALEKTVAHLPPPPDMADWSTNWPFELRTRQETHLPEPAPGTARLFFPAPGLGCIVVTCIQRFLGDCLELP